MRTVKLTGAGSRKYMGQILPVLLEASKSSDPSLRQCAVFGLGVLAEFQPEGFQQIAASAIQTLLAIINAPDSRSVRLPVTMPCPAGIYSPYRPKKTRFNLTILSPLFTLSISNPSSASYGGVVVWLAHPTCVFPTVHRR